MAGDLLINDEGLQDASVAFSSVSEAIGEQVELLDAKGQALLGVWMGVGSSIFSDTHDLIALLFRKTEDVVLRESLAVISAKERFKETDLSQAREQTDLGKLWTSIFGE